MAAIEDQCERYKPGVLSLPACPTNPGLRRTHIRCRRVFQERVEQTATGLDMRGSFRVERATDDFNSMEEFSASDVRVTVLNREINPDPSGCRSRTAAVVSSKGKLKRRLNKRVLFGWFTCYMNINQIIGIMENKSFVTAYSTIYICSPYRDCKGI